MAEDLEENIALWKLRRYCFLGQLEPVCYLKDKTVHVLEFLPVVRNLCKHITGVPFLKLIQDALDKPTSCRDETIFTYAAYLSSDVDQKFKNLLRNAFAVSVNKVDNLFLFCKYSMLIQNANKRRCFSKTTIKAVRSWYELKSPDELRKMWQEDYAKYGFSHHILIKLCHINEKIIGDKNIAKLWLEPSTVVHEAIVTENLPSSPSHRDLPQNKIKKISQPSVFDWAKKLRFTKNKYYALQIVKKFKLKFRQVPARLYRFPIIIQELIPTMNYLQLLKFWGQLMRYNYFQNPKIMKLCKDIFENKEKLRESNIHPICILFYMDKFGITNSEKTTAKKEKQNNYFKFLYVKSFGQNNRIGCRIHITMNLQFSYKKRYIPYHRTLSYYETAVGLAFSYFKNGKNNDVFYYSEDGSVKPIPWFKGMDIEDAFVCCDEIEIRRNQQNMIIPLFQATDVCEAYDVFIVIVPSATRSNPNQKSDTLSRYLNIYRENFKKNTKFIIISLLRFRRSMIYPLNRFENILEICGVDQKTPDTIYNFISGNFN